MLRLLIPLILFSSFAASAATNLFYRAYGNPKDRAVIFLHGGPGYNSYSFEASSAEDLAKLGNYVVVFDQRGCGRSPLGKPGDFNFKTATGDILDVIKALGLKSPVLVGHSWGGTLALKFLELQPGVARGVVLVSSPLSFPTTLFTLLDHCQAVYKRANNQAQIDKVLALEGRMFPAGNKAPYQFQLSDIESTFDVGMACGLYGTVHTTPEAAALWKKIGTGVDADLLSNVQTSPDAGFEANEHLYELELSKVLLRLRDRVYAIYGDEDGVFAKSALDQVDQSLPGGHFHTVHQASHNVFVDQHKEFLETLEKDLESIP